MLVIKSVLGLLLNLILPIISFEK